jgi:integrase
VKHVDSFLDRHGTRRFFFRRDKAAKRIPLPDKDDPGFMAAYEAALNGLSPPPLPVSKIKPGSVAEAMGEFFADASWTSLACTTRGQLKYYLEPFRRQHGHRMMRELDTLALQKVIDRLEPNPQAHLVAGLRKLTKFCRRVGHLDKNKPDPAQAVETKEKPKTDGFHTWTESDHVAFKRRWGKNTRPRLVYQLINNFGLRISDVVRLAPRHLVAGVMSIKPQKTQNSSKVDVDIDVWPETLEIMAANRKRQFDNVVILHDADTPFVLTDFRKPMPAKSLSNIMRAACDAAGLARCTSHGIRKSSAAQLAEDGGTINELMATFGWVTAKEAIRYTEKADRKRLAASGMKKRLAAKEG